MAWMRSMLVGEDHGFLGAVIRGGRVGGDIGICAEIALGSGRMLGAGTAVDCDAPRDAG